MKGIHHLSVHVELLVLGNLELLIAAIFQGEDHRGGRGHMKYLARNALHRGDDLGGSDDGDGPLQFHSYLHIVNSDFVTTYRDFVALRHISKVLYGAIFHPEHEVVTADMHHLSAIHFQFSSGLPSGGRGLGLHLCAQ